MPKSSNLNTHATGKLSRRSLLKHSVVALGAGFAGTTAAQAKVVPGDDPFDYEVTRTDAEWQAQLGDDYPLLRQGETEQPFTHPYWQLNEPGHFHCKGCDLLGYSSVRKFFPDKGWVFFTAGEPNAQMFSVDIHSSAAENLLEEGDETPGRNDIASQYFMEIHCRRCGSHLGHLVSIEGTALHCLNGGSLVFKPATA